MFSTITYRQDEFSSRPFSVFFFFFFSRAMGGGVAWDTINNIVYINCHGCDVAGLSFSRRSRPPPTDFIYVRRQY